MHSLLYSTQSPCLVEYIDLRHLEAYDETIVD